MPKPALTTDEAAKLLGVMPKRVRQLVRDDLLDAMELYSRLWYFTFESVERCRLALREKK
jgi:Helix-turn-helix domain